MLGPRVITIYWRDIPIAVNAQSGRTRFSQELPGRFRRCVDRAANHLPSSLAPGQRDWQVEIRRCSYDLELEVAAQVAQINGEYGVDRLRRLAENRGRSHAAPVATLS